MDEINLEKQKLLEENAAQELTQEELESVSGGAIGMKDGKPIGVYATWPISPDEMYQRARRAKAEGQTLEHFFHTYVKKPGDYPKLYGWLTAQWPCMR